MGLNRNITFICFVFRTCLILLALLDRDLTVSALVYLTLPPLFDLNQVADSESDLGLHCIALVLEIFAFYHFLEYERGRPGRRGHVHLGHNFSIQIFFSKVCNIF